MSPGCEKNSMFAVGRIDASWGHTVLTMLPKGGNLFSPSNWRPIAVLNITYKIFTKLVYKRLRPTLERHQSKDQAGVRPCTSVEDVFLVLESVCSKSLEWNFPVWFASLNVKKAFDRIEYSSCLVLYNHKVCLAHIRNFWRHCIVIFVFSSLLFQPQKSQSLGLFYWAVSRQ